MKVRFIPRVQRQLFLRGIHGATEAWTVKGETPAGKLVLAPPPRHKKKQGSKPLACFVEVHRECVVLN